MERGISALTPTVGLSGLPDPMGDATAALEARRRQKIEGAGYDPDVGLYDRYSAMLGTVLGPTIAERSRAAADAMRRGDMATYRKIATELSLDLGSFLGSIKSVGAPPYHLRPGVEPPTPNNPRGLPMDEASRMKRAEELGFTTEAYHGTPRERFQSFDPDEYGSVSGYDAGTEAGAWFTSDRAVANAYRTHGLRQEQGKYFDRNGGHVLDARLRLPDAEVFDVLAEGRRVADQIGMPNATNLSAQEAGELLGGAVRTSMVDDARQAGRSGLIIHNSTDDPGALLGRSPYPSTHYAVFDPANIRAKEATFDPERGHLADLLASIAPWAVLGGGAGIGSLYMGAEEGM